MTAWAKTPRGPPRHSEPWEAFYALCTRRAQVTHGCLYPCFTAGGQRGAHYDGGLIHGGRCPRAAVLGEIGRLGLQLFVTWRGIYSPVLIRHIQRYTNYNVEPRACEVQESGSLQVNCIAPIFI